MSNTPLRPSALNQGTGSEGSNLFGLPDYIQPSFDVGNGIPAAGTTVLYGSPTAALAGSLGTTTTKGTIVSASGTTSTSPFVINITWDSSVASAPTAFKTAVINAAQYLESQYTAAVTVNISVGYGEVGGTTMGTGALGASSSYLTYVSSTSLLNALKTHNYDSTINSEITALSASTVSGYTWVTTAEAKALGLAAATGTSTDGFVGFSSMYGFTYNNSTGVAAGTYDFNGTALHELTEVMGRIMLTGGAIGSYSPSYTLLDLLHYSAAGVRDLSASTPGYFSTDGGVTKGGTFNTVAGGDAGDWGSGMGNDALNAFSSGGVINAFSAADLKVMDALGWNLASNSSAPPPPPPSGTTPPTGIAITATTSALTNLEGTYGLNNGQSIATIVQTGGKAGDTFTYTLGGSGAGSFALSSAGALTSGVSTTAIGATNGKVFALTVTANDTTAAVSSAAMPLDVVVAGNGIDTVSVATLVGASATAAPTFIYGLAGNDTINATGMTGTTWMVGGAGADTMTGGTGQNRYLYASASESSTSAADVITNFHTATDVIDLTGIGGGALTYLGQTTGTTLAAKSIGWQVSGSTTTVYVNNGQANTPNMKIILTGALSLSSSNILHA